jgi:hypothetical protein
MFEKFFKRPSLVYSKIQNLMVFDLNFAILYF